MFYFLLKLIIMFNLNLFFLVHIMNINLLIIYILMIIILMMKQFYFNKLYIHDQVSKLKQFI